MSRGHSKGNTGTIHQYFTRQNSTTTCPGPDEPDEKSVQFEGHKMAVSNAELKKLIQGLESKMDKKLDDGFASLTERMDSLTEKVDSLEVDCAETKTAQGEDREKIELLVEEIGELKRSLLRTQVYSRKTHLLLYGVEGYETSPTVCIDRVRRFAVDHLKLDERYAKNLIIRNAHRLHRRDDGPTPIIVVFLYMEERATFLKAGRNLAGTRMSVRTDLPPELKQKRGQLAHTAYEIRRDEKIHARVQERDIDVWIETRKTSSESWVKRL